ncbi:MAG: hypothetical protein QOD40_3034 [Alphaproteobacteria bacterium]|nr:hypothetical protein [Alphaproteobacteria bacterium]
MGIAAFADSIRLPSHFGNVLAAATLLRPALSPP